jgi:hypothetical protein
MERPVMSIHRLAPAARRSRAAGWLLLLAAAAAAGCGKHGVATVKGKVTFGNQPVGSGKVFFVAADNTTGSAALNDDGTYTMTDAPVGDVRIGVSVGPRLMMGPNASVGQSPLASTPGAVPEAEKMKNPPPIPGGTHWVPVPPKYSNHETSGLSWTVPAGGGEHDIPLTP